MCQSFEEMTKEEQAVYDLLLHQCHSTIKKNSYYARTDEQFESMISMCSINNLLSKLMDLYPDPLGAIVVLRELIRKQCIVETRDKNGYPAFVPQTYMVVEEVRYVHRKKNQDSLERGL